MAVDIEVTKGLRGVADLRRLVLAVVAGDEHDEPDWLEWKSTLDLSGKEGCFHVARAVLGLANRLPDRAALTCEGLGYIVVGAEPGSSLGIATVDPATLTQIIEPYLGGAEGPAWTPTYLTSEDVTVLVVVVEAPGQGDPIFTLRREFRGARSGTVFVRKHGLTVPADAADMDALQARLISARPLTALEVGLQNDVPISWFEGATARDSLEEWILARAQRLEDAARERERERLAPKPTPTFGATGALAELAERMATQQSAFFPAAFRGQEDARTLDEYLAEVEKWKERAFRLAPAVVLGQYVDAGHGVVAVTVTNPTGRFLTDVEVEVVFEGDHVGGFEEPPEVLELPPEPRPFGQRTPSPLLSSSLNLDMSLLSAQMAVPPNISSPWRRTWIKAEEGALHIRFHVGDLRQHGKDASAEAYLLVKTRPESGVLHGTWKATIRDQEGVIEGVLNIPLSEEPVALVRFLARQRSGDSDT